MEQPTDRFKDKRAKIVTGFVLLGLMKVVTAAAAESGFFAGSQNTVQRFEIIVDSYSFTPDRLVVKVNIPVELVFKSASWIVPHNFVLTAPEAAMAIEAEIARGGTTIIRFTPMRTGEFKFRCTKKLLFFPSHEDMGMVGTLVVER